jgi:hypothetical protein
MRSISRADKLCRSNGVGMSEAIDLAIAEAEPPTAAKRKQTCYVQLGRAPFYFSYIFISFFVFMHKNIPISFRCFLFITL